MLRAVPSRTLGSAQDPPADPPQGAPPTPPGETHQLLAALVPESLGDKEIEENNKMRKTRDLFKKIRETSDRENKNDADFDIVAVRAKISELGNLLEQLA